MTRSGSRNWHEIESPDELAHAVRQAGTGGSMAGWQLQDVDLGAEEGALLGLDAAGALVLGGTMSPELEQHLRQADREPGHRVPLLPAHGALEAIERVHQRRPRRPDRAVAAPQPIA